jgi:DNA-binding NarL/FixJ family response regulator
MESCQIVLANEPRLLRKMLQRVLSNREGLCVTAEITTDTELASVVEETNPQWVVVSLWPKDEIPQVVRSLLAEHPSLCILGLAADCSKVKIRCGTSSQERVLYSLSLDDLVEILRTPPL